MLMSVIKVFEIASSANRGSPLARLLDNVMGLPLSPQAESLTAADPGFAFGAQVCAGAKCIKMHLYSL